MCKQKSYGGLWPLSVCPIVQPSMLELVSALASADDCHQLCKRCLVIRHRIFRIICFVFSFFLRILYFWFLITYNSEIATEVKRNQRSVGPLDGSLALYDVWVHYVTLTMRYFGKVRLGHKTVVEMSKQIVGAASSNNDKNAIKISKSIETCIYVLYICRSFYVFRPGSTITIF